MNGPTSTKDVTETSSSLLFNPGLLASTSNINLGPQNVSHYQCHHLSSVCQTSHHSIQQSTLFHISTCLQTRCLDLHHQMQILIYVTRLSTATSLPNSSKVNIQGHTTDTTPPTARYRHTLFQQKQIKTYKHMSG